MSDLKKTLSSSFLLSFEAVLRKMVGLVSTLILARMLVPEDFGIITIALLAMGLLDAVKDFGGGTYLLRAETVTEEMMNTKWTIGALIATFIALVLVAVTPLIVAFFEDERLYAVLWVYSFLFIIKSLGNPSIVLLKRQQNYVPIVKVSIIGKIISVIAAITVALIYQNYWALVVGQATIAVTGVLGSYIIRAYCPKICFSELKAQWKFSGWWMLQSILGYCKSQLDTFLVSATFNKAALGSYHTMKYIASIPTTFLIAPATEPLLVQLAKIKETKEHFFKQYNVSLIVPLCIAIPGCIFLLFNHSLATLVVLGENWTEYSPLFAIFCVTIVTLVIQQHAARILVIYARTKAVFYFELLSFIVIYGYLILFKIDEIIEFSSAKITLELILAGVIFAYVSIAYTSLKNYLVCLFAILPILISSVIASYCTQLLILEASVFLQFLIVIGTFGLIYFSTLLLQAYLLRNISKEWHYIWDLLNKIISNALAKCLTQFKKNKA